MHAPFWLTTALRYQSYPALTDTSLLASDGYHPGPLGYEAMAGVLAEYDWLAAGTANGGN